MVKNEAAEFSGQRKGGVGSLRGKLKSKAKNNQMPIKCHVKFKVHVAIGPSLKNERIQELQAA